MLRVILMNVILHFVILVKVILLNVFMQCHCAECRGALDVTFFEKNKFLRRVLVTWFASKSFKNFKWFLKTK